jgi:hypothetical protein
LATLSTVVVGGGIEAWFSYVGRAWTSSAAVPFVLGNLAVGWGAVELHHRDQVPAGVLLGAAGTYAVLVVAGEILTRPVEPGLMGSLFQLRLILVLVGGSPAILAGAAVPAAWARWEDRRFGSDGAGGEPSR